MDVTCKPLLAWSGAGVPINEPLLRRLQGAWNDIKDRLIDKVDESFGVYDNGTFKEKRFAELIDRLGISWPRLDSGRLSLRKDEFRQAANAHPQLTPLYELRCNLGQMRLSSLQVGADGRNRAWLMPFGSRTSRNQPSDAKFIFGPSVWLRGLIKPEPGHAVAYIDYEQQEFGIAAV